MVPRYGKDENKFVNTIVILIFFSFTRVPVTTISRRFITTMEIYLVIVSRLYCGLADHLNNDIKCTVIS
jgi:hypothetical protein